MTRYLFSSHDGFGLGHVRRNSLIARAILADDPTAEVMVVTGLPVKPSWLDDHRIEVVRVPALLKDGDGTYRNAGMPFEQAVQCRADIFDQTIAAWRPDVCIVDRHPYGTAGELRPGLDRARDLGAAVVLGLRDVLDEPDVVRRELAGEGWRGVADDFDALLVYGQQSLCDHQLEYGLSVPPIYCGWVVEQAAPRPRASNLLVVTAGGGGDGDQIFQLGLGLARQLVDQRVILVAGPYARSADVSDPALEGRVELRQNVPSCVSLFAEASAVVQMAGYNSTVESLATGLRPVLMPRRSPRREQAIRASRLAALGLADVVDEGAAVDEVAWLLSRPRLLAPGQLADAGLDLDGARTAASVLRELASVVAR
ncbi:MAG: hypothetical protein R2733_08870 [Acidimicrobiales bacterium]